MSRVSEVIAELVDLDVPPKALQVLRKLWARQGTLLVESSDSPFTVRPRLAKKMAEAGLIELHGCDRIAIFGDKGSDIAFDLWGAEDE